MIRYDAAVIGSGQAGNPLAQKLADQGWTVAEGFWTLMGQVKSVD